jgi:hypothetical protein
MKSAGFSERFILTRRIHDRNEIQMSLQRRRAAWVGSVVFGTVLSVSGLAWANGQEFFAAPFGKVDLVYTGRVRNISGRFLQHALVVIWSEELGLTFPSVSDDLGHYRSPDVGAHIKEVTSAATVDIKGLKAACSLPGYEQVRPIVIPKKAHGAVELNCTLRKVGTGGKQDAAQTDVARKATPGLFWLVPVAMVLVVIGAAVRK